MSVITQRANGKWWARPAHRSSFIGPYETEEAAKRGCEAMEDLVQAFAKASPEDILKKLRSLR